MDPQKLVFSLCLVEQAQTGLAVSRHAFFPSHRRERLLALRHHLRIDMTPLQFKVKSLQVSEGARAGFKTAFPFEAIESLIDCQLDASQHKFFSDKSRKCTRK